MRKWVSILAAVSVVVAACGGSGDGADTGQADDVTTTQAAPSDGGGEETPATTAAADESEAGDAGSQDPPEAAGVGTATVTIDGETHTFGDAGIASQCRPDFFGVFLVTLSLTGDDGTSRLEAGSLSLALLQEDADPEELDQRPEVVVSIVATDQEWIASEEKAEEFELEPGTSQVDSYTIDGNTVTGTATFFEEDSYFAVAGGSADSIETATGTFEVTCVES